MRYHEILGHDVDFMVVSWDTFHSYNGMYNGNIFISEMSSCGYPPVIRHGGPLKKIPERNVHLNGRKHGTFMEDFPASHV